ncbi:MAG: transposase [Spirochaetales bacterium]|nr:transposase [Spirochaetales bacterium]
MLVRSGHSGQSQCSGSDVRCTLDVARRTSACLIDSINASLNLRGIGRSTTAFSDVTPATPCGTCTTGTSSTKPARDIRSPWQNPFAERWIRSVRTELLDQVIVCTEKHARILLKRSASYLHSKRRPHSSVHYFWPSTVAYTGRNRSTHSSQTKGQRAAGGYVC